MPDDSIFEEELEQVQESIDNPTPTSDSEELSSEMQDQLRQIESLASMDPSFRETKEYQDFMASLEASDEASDDDEEEEEEEEDEDNELEDTDDIEDVFGVFKNSKKPAKVKIDFEVPEGMESMLSSKYGIEDASTFFSSVDTWRTQAQAGTEVQNELDALTSDLQSMPPDLRQAISMWASSEDYTQVFSNGGRLNFDEGFESQDSDYLVQHYLPEQYSTLQTQLEKGDIEESEFNDKVKLLSSSTKRTFTDEKKALEKQRADFVTQQANEQKLMKNSAISSVENLSKAYPNFSKTELKRVEKILVEGKVDDLFYNPDGSYTKEAAELVANAMYAGKTRGMIEKVAKRQGKSEANQEFVDSSPKKMRKQRAAQNKGVNTEAVDHLGSVFKGDPYE